MADQTKVTEFTRTPGTVFVNVSPPENVQQMQNTGSYFSQWGTVASDMASDPTEEVQPDKKTPQPKMNSEGHHNDRFLARIQATLKVIDDWATADQVFDRYYNKYDHANVIDIQIGLDILTDTGEIQSEMVKGTRKYHSPVSDFERFLEAQQVSKYHLADIASIDHDTMCGYADGSKMTRTDAIKIANALDIEISHLNDFVLEEPTPTAEDLLAAHLPQHIEASRWNRYVVVGPAPHIFDNTTLIYHDPCLNFWDLYHLAKGVFRDLGIKLSKAKGAWEARIPICALTDKVFVDSGLAAVEKTLLAGTGIDPAKLSTEIRNRQLANTKRGIAKVKAWRETLGDAVGVLAITTISWATYVIGGAV